MARSFPHMSPQVRTKTLWESKEPSHDDDHLLGEPSCHAPQIWYVVQTWVAFSVRIGCRARAPLSKVVSNSCALVTAILKLGNPGRGKP